MQEILIYVHKKTPRVSYIFSTLLKTIACYSFDITSNKDFFIKSTALKINYSATEICPSSFFLPPHALLFETHISKQEIHVSKYQNLPAFFFNKNKKADFPFDIFAASFYLISRYEEYLVDKKDNHQRFCSYQSLAYQEEFLHLPIIQLWLLSFFEELSKRNASFVNKKRLYSYQPTFDIDMAWSYKNKGLIRTLGGFLRDFKNRNFVGIYTRFQVLLDVGNKKDPFDTFSFLEKMHENLTLRPIYFFLLGDLGKYDKNISPKHPAFIRLVQKIHQKEICGIHPSYKSNLDPLQLRKEMQRLSDITNSPVTKSRQHFLKLTFPQTYQNLLLNGISEDYTMGYAANIGFRASIGIPFFWYDLTEEKATNLQVFPFQVMDVTLKEYLKLTPKEALDRVKGIIEIMKKTGGVFTTLWHNSSFAQEEGWNEGWKKLYEDIVDLAKE